MTDTPEVAAARIEVERSRGRLMATAHQLQDRLSPKVLAGNAWQGAKEKGADLAEDAVDAVKARPIATGGIIAAVTMFLAREPLMELAGSMFRSGKPKRKTRASRNAERKQDDTEKVE